MSRRACGTALSALVLAAAGAARAGEEARLAVIAGEGERAPSEAVLARLEVELSREGGIGVVERARVQQILAEHKLAAAGLVDAEAAVRIGRLLSADLLLFVERLPGKGAPACRIHVVETRTGITLGALLGTEKSLGEDVSPAVRALRSALAKLAVPDEARRYVGILGFRSEEPGRALDGLAEALGALLAADLGASSSVVLLDREHLEHLSRERDLTGAELDLKASAFILDGGLRRAPGAEELEITVHVRPLTAGPRQRVAVRVPADDVPRARRQLTKAVLGELGAEPVEAADRDPKEEAAIFAERAGILVSHEEYESALRAAEAALALDRNQETRYWAARAWKNLAWRPFKEARRQVHKRAPLEEIPIALKARILRAHLREKSLLYELWRHHERRLVRGEEKEVVLPSITGPQGTIRIPALPGEREIEGLRDEIERLDKDTLQFALDYYAERWNEKHAQYYWWEMMERVLHNLQHWAENAEEWSALFGELFSRYESPPGEADARFRHGFLSSLVDACYVTLPQRFTTPEDRRVVLDTLGGLASRKDPLLRMAGLVCKALFPDREDADSAKAALKVLLKELPLDHPESNVEADCGVLPYLASRAIEVFKDPTEKARHCRAVLEPVMEARDAYKLAAWRFLIPRWLDALERCHRLAEADRAAQRLIDVLRKGSAGSLRERANELVRSLEGSRARYAEKLARGLPLSAEWAAYEMGRVDFAAAAGIYGGVEASLLQGRRLILVRAQGRTGDRVRLQVTSVPVGGGEGALLGEMKVRCDRVRHDEDLVTCVAADGASVYVGTTGGGFVAVRDGNATVWTEEKGLPASTVRSIACYRGKVYLGVGEGSAGLPISGALVSFDPVSARFEILASSRSQEGRSPLDGGKPYSINVILADDERECLWLGVKARHVSGRDWPWKKHGLWKYHPEEGRTERVWMPKHHFEIRSMRWRRGEIICSAWANLVIVDPETLKKVRLAGDMQWVPVEDSKSRPLFVFGDPHVTLWPCALIGDHLLTGGKQLRLHTGGDNRPAILRRTPEGQDLLHVVFMHEIDGGAIIGTRRGGFWTIRPKSSPAGRGRRE